MTDVTVVVPTRNRVSHLPESLGSVLTAAARAPMSTEVLVVDNNSTDGTVAYLESLRAEHPTLRYVVEPRRGVSAARNRAADEAQGRALLFADDDVRVPAGWIEPMVAPILGGTADAIAGGIRLAPHLNRPWMTSLTKRRFADTASVWGPDQPVLISANLALAAAVMSHVRFDEELGPGTANGSGDDILFSLQVFQAGYRVTAVAEPAVEHRFDEQRLEPEQLVRLARAQGRSDAYIFRHWLHTGIRWSQLRAAKHAAQAALRRLRGGPEVDEQLLQLVQDVAFHRRLAVEQRRPPAYDRRGLVKRTAGALPVAARAE